MATREVYAAAILRQLLQDVVDQAMPYRADATNPEPEAAAYLLPTGPIHRALAYLRDEPAPDRGDP